MDRIGKGVGAVLVLLAQCLLVASVAFAQEKMSGEEIVKRSHLAFFYAGEDMKAKVRMRLINPQGKERARAMTMVRKDEQEGGEQKHFIYFHQPADVREMTFMVNHDDDVHSAYDVGIGTHSPFFSETFNAMFELAWNGMKSGKKQ